MTGSLILGTSGFDAAGMGDGAGARVGVCGAGGAFGIPLAGSEG